MLLAFRCRQKGIRAIGDRALDVIYGIRHSHGRGAPHAVYTARLPSEPPAAPASFFVPHRSGDRNAVERGLPLVIVSHGLQQRPRCR